MLLVRRALVYGYANARTKAMKALLLPATRIREMVSVRTPEEVAELMQETPYKEDITALSATYAGAELVERALSRNLLRTANKLLRITPPQGREVLWRLLRRWDVSDLKMLFVAKHTGQPNTVLEGRLVGLGPAGRLARLLQAKDVPSLVEELEPDYRSELAPMLKEYAASHDILLLINALDRFYFTNLAQSAEITDEPAVAALIKNEIDAKNISTILRAKSAGVPAQKIAELLIPGGNIKLSALEEAAAAADVKGAATLLQKAARIDFSDALAKYTATGSIAHFEIALEKTIMRRVVKTMRLAVLSLAAILSFLYLKEMEVGNIRKIVRGKEYELPREKIEEMIYVVG
ncbi:MAG: V-type ATPase subunit [Candidatus Micrarchaeia archaeon]